MWSIAGGILDDLWSTLLVGDEGQSTRNVVVSQWNCFVSGEVESAF